MQAIEYLASQKGVNRDRLGLLGLSLGGSIVSCVSWQDPGIKAVALWAPVADIPGVFQANLEPEKMEQLSQTGSYDYNGDVVGMNFIQEIGKFKPVEEISKFKGPVLIIHGDADELVPIENAMKLQKALQGREKLIIIKGAGHTFDSEVWEKQVIETTAGWFKEVLL